jgi:two-component system invasion response regulator UvrY
MSQSAVKIGLVDDHIMIRDALASAIKSFDEFDISLLAENGKDFISKLNNTNIPEILILDLNMPVMNGHETIYWLLKNHPEIKILVLSMYDADSLIHLIKIGVRGFVKKEATPSELRHAIQSVLTTGTYCSSSVTSRLFSLMKDLGTKNSYWGTIVLNECEIAFLKLVATEQTYKEIAQKMKVSPRTVDNYRDALFLKLNVKSRVGLAVYAIKSGIVTLNF